MFYNELKTIKACEEDPSLIFDLIKEGHFELVDKLLSKKIVSVNEVDNASNDVITRLLKARQYDLVLKYMKNKNWNVNHQNYDGNTFGHYLAGINYVHVLDIIKQLKKNKEFSPNIKNKKGETLLDKAINENYIYTTLKILEDKRFNNIDVMSFKKIFDTYITNSSYGKYSKLDNLKSIISSLEKKESLLPNLQELIKEIVKNMDVIKNELMKNKYQSLEVMISEFV